MEQTLTDVDPSARIHPTALIEEGVSIGPRTAVWAHVHIRQGAKLGHDVIVGEKTYIAYDVAIGNWVKINAMVYICAQVTIADGVMISAGTIFTNDLFPRSMSLELDGLETSDVTDETLATGVGQGATLGAGCRIGPGLSLGPFCMVGMGAVVTRDVPAHALVVGNPARVIGYLCACGPRLVDAATFAASDGENSWRCGRCHRVYGKREESLHLLQDPHEKVARLR